MLPAIDFTIMADINIAISSIPIKDDNNEMKKCDRDPRPFRIFSFN